MTVLMTDAQGMLGREAKAAVAQEHLEDVLFADDTLLIGRCGKHVEEYMLQ